MAAARADSGRSRAALEALQLERSAGNAAPCLREQCELPAKVRCGRGRIRTICARSPDLSRFPLTTKADLQRGLSVRLLLCAHGAGGANSCILRHHRQGHGRGLYPEDLKTWSDLVARSIRAAGGRAGMKVHIAYGYGLFTGGLGRTTAPRRRDAR